MIEELIEGLEQGWRGALTDFKTSDDYQLAREGLNAILNVAPVNYHPTEQDIFAAFNATPFNRVRVVIIGQDPYWEPDEATGLAFFADGKYTPSLRNINAAIRCDNVGNANSTNVCLKRWAEKEGVLLLNSVLTFCNNGRNKNRHTNKNWEEFMGAVLTALVNNDRMLQFMLWGNNAKELKKYINGRFYHIHASPHPTSRGDDLKAFKNCHHFSAVNNILRARGEPVINWIDAPQPPPEA